MRTELYGENGLNLYAKTKEGYEIFIKLGYDNRHYADFNLMAMYIYKYFHIDKDYPIQIQNNNEDIIAIIHDEN